MEILDHAAVMRTKLAKAGPAAGEEQPAQESMFLLHTGPFLIQRGEISTADKLLEFAGQILDGSRSPSRSSGNNPVSS
jgi:hypothetical protein